jgi:aryl-alcohol dehydrogenase-like predicted oxidoreductase
MQRREFIAAMGGVVLPDTVREFHRGGMRYRRLGRTGLFVSALGFGAHTDYQQRTRGPNGIRLRDDFQAVRTRQTDRAIDLGINLVDVYDEAQQWEPLAGLAKPKRDRVLIATKFNENRGNTAWYIDRAARLFGYTDLGRYVVREDGAIRPESFENWDLLRRAKAAGKIRAIGIATHSPEVMRQACRDLEGLEFIYFPYNFIHAQAAYGEFIPAAVEAGIGLIAMKPLASGSIVKLDRRRPRPDARPEIESMSTALNKTRPLPEQAVAKLAASLERSADETLAQAALRFVFAQPFIACALTGMFRPEELEENYQAFVHHVEDAAQPSASLFSAARELAVLSRTFWLPEHYRWLDQRWISPRS